MQEGFAVRCWSALCAKWPDLVQLNSEQAEAIIAGSVEAYQKVTGFTSRVPGQDRNGIPPSLNQVQAYVIQLKSPINPEDFVDYYSQKGWELSNGGGRMKDWQAAVRLWTRRHTAGNAVQPQAQHGSASLFALQAQLKTVENELTDLLYPGGSQFKMIPTGANLVRFEKLALQRKSLKAKIDNFSS